MLGIILIVLAVLLFYVLVLNLPEGGMGPFLTPEQAKAKLDSATTWRHCMELSVDTSFLAGIILFTTGIVKHLRKTGKTEISN